uniref:Uncharacterized protein n=1 Tax=Isometrus maculatus TaxID=497827 RepID=A0A0U1SAB3_ISOMC|nr:hypothetical protein [Isometrus maculatus]
MKSLVLLGFLSIWGSALAYTPAEMAEALCSVPDKYLLRFINCTIERSPKVFQKAADVLYKCVDSVYENEGKIDSIIIYGCYEDDSEVRECLNKESKNLGKPSSKDITDIGEAAKYCLVNG